MKTILFLILIGMVIFLSRPVLKRALDERAISLRQTSIHGHLGPESGASDPQVEAFVLCRRECAAASNERSRVCIKSHFISLVDYLDPSELIRYGRCENAAAVRFRACEMLCADKVRHDQ